MHLSFVKPVIWIHEKQAKNLKDTCEPFLESKISLKHEWSLIFP